MKEQADNIILESLNYSKRMLANVISVIIFIIGIAFIISPLFLVKLYNQHTTSFTPREITQSEAHT